MIREGELLREGTWDEAEQLLAARIGATGNVMFIGGRMGPSMSDLVDEFVTAVNGTRVQYDAVSDAPLLEAARMAYGAAGLPSYDIASARLLLSFSNDFIETGSSPVAHNKGLAEMSAVDAAGSKGRFVYLGPRLSTTGLNADEWIPIRPGSADVLRAYSPAAAAQAAGVGEDSIRELAESFASESPTLALGPGVGGHHRNATAANIAVMILNEVAGNVGRTVHYDVDVTEVTGADRPGAAAE